MLGEMRWRWLLRFTSKFGQPCLWCQSEDHLTTELKPSVVLSRTLGNGSAVVLTRNCPGISETFVRNPGSPCESPASKRLIPKILDQKPGPVGALVCTIFRGDLALREMVGRDGFEPSTNWLKANCSTS